MARRSPTIRRTKDKIAAAALELFSDRGFHAVTVDEIVEATGVTKGSFYYYFSDKEDLAADLWHDLWARLAATAEATYDGDADVATNLKLCFRALLSAISDLGRARFFLRDAWVLPTVETAGRADQEAAVTIFGSLLDQARANGELADVQVEAATRVLLGAYAEGVLHILHSSTNAEPTLTVLDTIVDAIVPGPSGEHHHPCTAAAPPRSSPARRRT